MADKTRMEKVDMAKEFTKLSETEKHFVRKLENMNKDRANDLKHLRKRNMFTGLLLGAGVLSIYFYAMYAVRQEKFLDFDTVPDDTKKNAS